MDSRLQVLHFRATRGDLCGLCINQMVWFGKQTWLLSSLTSDPPYILFQGAIISDPNTFFQGFEEKQNKTKQPITFERQQIQQTTGAVSSHHITWCGSAPHWPRENSVEGEVQTPGRNERTVF